MEQDDEGVRPTECVIQAHDKQLRRYVYHQIYIHSKSKSNLLIN